MKSTKRRLPLRLCYMLLSGMFLAQGLRAQPVNTGPTNPGSAGDATLGSATFTWNNPPGAQTSGGSTSTTTTILSVFSGTSDYLQLTNFGFNIPTGSIITGVTATVDRSASGLSLVILGIPVFATVSDNIVTLAGISSSNLANTTAQWSGSPSTATYGGSGTTWGASLTPAIVNSPAFGIDISVTLGGVLGLVPGASIDAVTLNVTYSPPMTLAIRLDQWTVTRQGNANILAWTDPTVPTAPAAQTNGPQTAQSAPAAYSIERSPDGKSWQDLATIAAIPGQQSYSYADQDPYPNTPAYYRLRLTNPDGSKSWSTIQVINGQTIPTISLYPNPFHDLINISATHGFSRVALKDLQGHSLWTAEYGTGTAGTPGTTSAQIPAANLAPGLYFVQIDDLTYKLIKN